jgi:hypothetical protein
MEFQPYGSALQRQGSGSGVAGPPLETQTPVTMAVMDAASSALVSGSSGTQSASSTGIEPLDPLRFEELRVRAVDSAVRAEAFLLLGGTDGVTRVSQSYFDGTHLRLPIVSRAHFDEDLAGAGAEPAADLLVLCLAMQIVQQRPPQQQHPAGQSMHSPLYVAVKRIMSLLEATSYSNIFVIQARLLIIWFEIGHNMYSNAYITIAACARAARRLELHKQQNAPATVFGGDRIRLQVEERRRTWWAIVNLDRFVALPYSLTFSVVFHGSTCTSMPR